MKISLFVLAGTTSGSSAEDCSQFNGNQQMCTSQASCEWWPEPEPPPFVLNGVCENKDSGVPSATASYVSLEASEEKPASHLRAGQVKK